jgi:tetratricopeptide (TPR) repeat protein
MTQTHLSSKLRVFASLFLLSISSAVAQIEEHVRLNNEGVEKMHNRNFQAAVHDFSQSIAKNPKFVLPYINRGLVLELHLGKFEDALTDYNSALRVSPNDLFALSDRARVLEKLGRYKPALQDYSTLISHYPSSEIKFLKARAKVREKLKDFSGAKSDLKRAQSLESEKSKE